MPNHITNKLKVVGNEEQVKEVMEFIKNDELGLGSIDFNKITPMPRWIYGSSPDVQGISREDIAKWGEKNTSLEWARNNWGTKWDAYGQDDSRNNENTIYFMTAWNGVPALIQKIAWIFPNVTLEYSFADEDLGSNNNGIFKFKENEILEKIQHENDSKEAYEIAFELCECGEIPSYYQFNKEINTYEYLEDEE